MLNPLDFVAPRATQHYVGPSTRYRVMPRRIDWFAVIIAIVMLTFIGCIVSAIVGSVI